MVFIINIWDDVGVARATCAFRGEHVDSACVWVQAFKNIGDAYERCFFIFILFYFYFLFTFIVLFIIDCYHHLIFIIIYYLVIMITIWDDVGVERAQHEHEVLPPCAWIAHACRRKLC